MFYPIKFQSKSLFKLWFWLVGTFVASGLGVGKVEATHLVGGDVGYEFLGQGINNTNYKRYRIYLNVYRDCSPSSTGFDPNITASIYYGSGSKSQFTTITMSVGPIVPVNPFSGGSNCSFAPNVCVEATRYQSIVELPVDSMGFHILWQRCCRNNSIVNLIPQQGQSYYTFIPDTRFANSSPIFADVPVPYICINDTVTYTNNASDPDGDSLTYVFVTPFTGGSASQPIPVLPFNLPTIPFVGYAAGYSATFPFGTSGVANIDPITGFTTVMSPALGTYVLAFEVREYRNGVLIARTRRDIQILSLSCPPNPKPLLSNAGQSGVSTFTIDEGDTLCFPITVVDVDSMYLTSIGDVFTGANGFSGPLATLANTSGFGSVTGNFCWNTACGQGRTTPYTFTVKVRDNGCPPKTSVFNYIINVNKTTGATAIAGVFSTCSNVLRTFTVNGLPGNTYNWSVTGGVIQGVPTGPSAGIIFTQSGNQTITVAEISAAGCTTIVTKLVNVLQGPAADAGPPVTICSGGSATIGTTLTGTITYSWSPSIGLSATNIAQPTVSLVNTGTANLTQKYFVTATNLFNGCSATDSVVVTVRPLPAVAAGNDRTLCSGDSSRLGNVNSPGANTYSWSPTNFLSSANTAAPFFNATTPGTFTYILTTTSIQGCVNRDTVVVTVLPLPVVYAGQNDTICSGQNKLLGGPGQNGTTYLWTPGNNLSSNSVAQPTFNFVNFGNTPVSFTYILRGTRQGCILRDTVIVTVLPRPIVNAGVDQSFCSADSITIGSAPNAGYSYSWSPSLGLANPNASQTQLSRIRTGLNPQLIQYVLTATDTQTGCFWRDTVMVTVRPQPVVTAGPNVQLCGGEQIQLGNAGNTIYSYAWNPGTGLSNPGVSNPLFTAPFFGNDTVLTLIVEAVGNQCSVFDTILIGIKSATQSPPVTGDFEPCILAIENYSVSQTLGSTYQWVVNGGAIISGQGTSTVSIQWGGLGFASLSVLETDLRGCQSDTSVVSILINEPQNDTVFGPTTVCPFVSGTQYWVAPDSLSTFQWVVQNGVLVGPTTGDTVLVDWAASGTGLVGVIETNRYGCSGDTSWKLVTIDPNLVTPPPLGDTVVCTGDTGLIYATVFSTGSNYVWTISGGTITSGQGTYKVTVNWGSAGTGILAVQEFSAVPCQGLPVTTNVTIAPYPTAPVIQGPTQVCLGDTVPFTVNVINTSTVQWTVAGGQLISGQGNDSILVRFDSLTNSQLTAVETNFAGCTGPIGQKASMVNPLPAGFGEFDTIVCAGVPIALGTSNNPLLAYSWQPANLFVNPTSSQGIFLMPVGNLNLDTVEVYATQTFIATGCSTTDTIVVVVQPAPVFSLVDSAIVCDADTVQIDIIPDPLHTYAWSSPLLVGPSTQASAQFLGVNTTQAPVQSYAYVLVTDIRFGCTFLDSTIIIVNPRPIANAGLDIEFCSGETFAIGAPTTPNYVYSWSPAIGLSSSTVSNPSVTLTHVGLGDTVYQYIVTTAFLPYGCDRKDTVNVRVKPLPIAEVGPDRTVCNGDTVILSSPQNPFWSYQWSPAANALSSTFFLTKAVFRNFGTQDTVIEVILQTVFTQFGCNKADTAYITVRPTPTPFNLTGDVGVCQFDPEVYSVSPRPGQIHTWRAVGGTITSANPSDTVTVTWQVAGQGLLVVAATDTFGCVGLEDTLQIVVTPKPATPQIIGDTIVCPGRFTNKVYIAEPNLPGTYQWIVSGGIIVNTPTNNTVEVTWQESTLPGKLSLVYLNLQGCASDTVVVNILVDDPSVSLDQATLSVNSPDNILLYWTPGPDNLFLTPWEIQYRRLYSGNAYQIQSVQPGDSISNLIDDLLPNKMAYDFKIIGRNACGDTISSNRQATLFLTAELNSFQSGAQLRWNRSIGWEPGVQYRLGVGLNDTLLPSRLVYDGTDTTAFVNFGLEPYRVCFRVAAEQPLTKKESFSNIICLNLDPTLYIPNAFTPNGDENNGFFLAKGAHVKFFEMEIYSRWGQRIYQSNSLEEGWDGNVQGKPATQGSYVYRIKYSGADDEVQLMTGMLHLFR